MLHLSMCKASSSTCAKADSISGLPQGPQVTVLLGKSKDSISSAAGTLLGAAGSAAGPATPSGTASGAEAKQKLRGRGWAAGLGSRLLKLATQEETVLSLEGAAACCHCLTDEGSGSWLLKGLLCCQLA